MDHAVIDDPDNLHDLDAGVPRGHPPAPPRASHVENKSSTSCSPSDSAGSRITCRTSSDRPRRSSVPSCSSCVWAAMSLTALLMWMTSVAMTLLHVAREIAPAGASPATRPRA
jgi:hypothetical protein